MLESLQIRNFAIIDALELEFDSGLSALTGETGAGKSIILDALKLVAGDRAESESIRSGADRAEISACFRVDNPAALRWLSDNEMNTDDDCVIRRVLQASGRSRAFINGYSATLAQLRELCDLLIDIHGQHEHQSLQKSQVQRQLLDAFVDQPKLQEEVRQRAEHCRELERKLEQARSGSQERGQRIDLLGLYCDELNQLNLKDNEYEQLQAEYRRLSNAGNLLDTTGRILGRLYEDEENSIQSALGRCEQDLAALLGSDARLGAGHELINGALIQIQEAVAELRDYLDGIELDDARLETLNQRIALIQNLARKHHVDASALPELARRLDAELEALQGEDFDLDALQSQLQDARDAYRQSAAGLSRGRQQTAASLSQQITGVMQQLGMQGGHFSIEVEAGDRISPQGIDEIRYLVSTNPGQPPKTLSRVASGGELSRISLAIQVIMSESSRIPTLIFDEVDSGVGGGIAEIVGRKLRLLGRQRQVFCVTHLPQVAAQAHHHFRVEKSSRRDATRTEVFALDGSERLEEIARMLGGIKITEQTRAHASEMIAAQE